MKKLFICTFFFLVFFLSGCSETPGSNYVSDTDIQEPEPVSVKSGFYLMEGGNGDYPPMPQLRLDTNEQSFGIWNMVDSSSGYYVIEDGKLICTSADGDKQFRFQIIDENTVSFIKEGSTMLRFIYQEISTYDGAVFSWTDPLPEK